MGAIGTEIKKKTGTNKFFLRKNGMRLWVGFDCLEKRARNRCVTGREANYGEILRGKVRNCTFPAEKFR